MSMKRKCSSYSSLTQQLWKCVIKDKFADHAVACSTDRLLPHSSRCSAWRQGVPEVHKEQNSGSTFSYLLPWWRPQRTTIGGNVENGSTESCTDENRGPLYLNWIMTKTSECTTAHCMGELCSGFLHLVEDDGLSKHPLRHREQLQPWGRCAELTLPGSLRWNLKKV